jgi:predicted RNA-binding Zn-ribbon protein involved in translation (DUF1610 family)
MAKDYQEKEFDDEVYEDGYYEDNYEEEELEEDGEEKDKSRKTVKKPKKSLIETVFEDDEKEKDEDDDDDDDDEEKEDSWEKERKINVSYACEDCDYRWDDIVIKKSEFDSEEEIFETACPMCGSMSITQI